ncbi:dolichyl-diphosphooligosaccharide--protein glycosyltransferase subunit 2-like [Acanthaster planci]|uniref:Dolichyl-diphosphooligosaccharide--protein glycosyltransferase subunit 2 n=1 Tax=Acanthaster planci TaxID=133434 RepID=A0A8B7Y6B7_ACAPL|nr:dolichyl-diphosphooligosaccharide--protein glycosyltransferase subunit 2-like [Acanthaster planci]
MERGAILLVFLLCTVLGQALSPITILSLDDQAKIKAVFASARPFTDLAEAHYSILGLKLFSVPIPNPQEACTFLKAKLDPSNVESVYHATTAAKALENCKVTVNEQSISSAINDSVDMATLFYAVSALTTLGLKFSSTDVLKSLDSALKKDDGVTSSSYALHIAALLPAETNMDKYFDLVEDIVAQADEVDEKYLQFDTLFQSGLFLDGAYKLAAKINKKPLITEDQAVMLGNFVLSRKSTQTVANAYSVVIGARALASNKFHVPVSFTRVGTMAVSTDAPNVKVQVSNLMAGSVGKLTVEATSISPKDGGKAVAKDLVFDGTKQPTEYQLNLMESKPAPAFYAVALKATPTSPNPALIGLSEGTMLVKVTTEVTVDNMEISVIDKDQSITAKTVKVVHPRKVDKGLEADHHQSVVLKFNLKDKAGQPLSVHQAFVRLSNIKTKQEVIFTADSDASMMYKFSLDVAESGREYFNQQSDKYTLDLIIGDAIIMNPFSWNLADVTLKFPEQEDTKPAGQARYAELPEIKHMFRVPEKRPPTAVSTTFTVLCLVPLLILIILWLKLGANVKGFTFSIGAIGFHLGLGAILGLFYCYWVYLNMFQTLQYLGLLGIFTFLTGNRLLSSIAQKKREK